MRILRNLHNLIQVAHPFGWFWQTVGLATAARLTDEKGTSFTRADGWDRDEIGTAVSRALPGIVLVRAAHDQRGWTLLPRSVELPL